MWILERKAPYEDKHVKSRDGGDERARPGRGRMPSRVERHKRTNERRVGESTAFHPALLCISFRFIFRRMKCSGLWVQYSTFRRVIVRVRVRMKANETTIIRHQTLRVWAICALTGGFKSGGPVFMQQEIREIIKARTCFRLLLLVTVAPLTRYGWRTSPQISSQTLASTCGWRWTTSAFIQSHSSCSLASERVLYFPCWSRVTHVNEESVQASEHVSIQASKHDMLDGFYVHCNYWILQQNTNWTVITGLALCFWYICAVWTS